MTGFVSAALKRRSERRILWFLAGAVVVAAAVMLSAGLCGGGEQTPPAKPRLWVLMQPGDPTCEQFQSESQANPALRDYLARNFDRTLGGNYFMPLILTEQGWTNAEAGKAFQTATGYKVPPSFPAFWVEGARPFAHGYSNFDDLRKYLDQFIWKPRAAAESEPVPQCGNVTFAAPSGLSDLLGKWTLPAVDPSAAAANGLDWSMVTMALILPKQDVDAVEGKKRELIISGGNGPLSRLFSELTEGKADLRIISERISPESFHAVVTAAGVAPDQPRLLVLVRQLDLGLKGQVAAVAEKLIEPLGAQMPVDCVFERVHPDDFKRVQSALQGLSKQPAPPVSPGSPNGSPWWHGAVFAFYGMARRWLGGRRA